MYKRQVISNSVTSSFENAFGVPPIYTTIILVAVAAVIVLRKNATVKAVSYTHLDVYKRQVIPCEVVSGTLMITA